MNFTDDELHRVPASSADDPPDDEDPSRAIGAPGSAADVMAFAPQSAVAAAGAAETFGDLIDSVVEMDRLLATVSAWRAELVDQARLWSESTRPVARPGPGSWSSRTIARRCLVTELACALRVPERTAENLIEESKALVHELPATLQALREGGISYRHGQRIVNHIASMSSTTVAGFEAELLPFAKTLTVTRFETKARTMRERLDPSSITARHVAAVADRELQLEPGRDGMSWLGARLPAATAHAAYDRVTRIAVGLQRPDEERTLTQLRADVFADLIIDGSKSAADRGIRAKVLVTVPVMTLLGHSEEPALLEGYGPIDADTARHLAAHAPSFTRILTHPETGAVLSVGRDSYVVPSDLRTWLRVRDGTCRFPGCNRGAGRCDIDHTCDWQFRNGTDHDNLANLCSGHHKLKHNTEWTVAHARDGTGSGDGTLNWTAPSGKRYTTEPATVMNADPPPF